MRRIYETMSAAEYRTGFSRKQLVRLIDTYRVPVRRARPSYIIGVDALALNAAIERHLADEPIPPPIDMERMLPTLDAIAMCIEEMRDE